MSHNLTNTLWPTIFVDYDQFYLILINVISMLIAIPGNFIITYTILKSSTLWEQLSFRCLLSVSVADFFIGALGQPLLMARIAKPNNDLLDKLSFTIIWMLCSSSGFGVLMVTMERFLYFQYPFTYNSLLTGRRTVVIILLQWMLGIFFGSISLIYRNDKLWYTVTLCTLFSSNITMITVYYKVRRTIISAKKADKKTRQNIGENNNKSQKNNIFLFVIVTVFCGFWYPAVVSNLIRSYHKKPSEFLDVTVYWTTTLGCLNSSFNIFIYGLANKLTKREIVRILRRDFKIGLLWNIS